MGSDQTSENGKRLSNGKEQRNFGCPCGKTYLSYPALFTHVKQKHGGKVLRDQLRLLDNQLNLRARKLVEDPGQTQQQLIVTCQSNDSDAQESPFNAQQELSRALSEFKAHREFTFQITEGRSSCNDMMSSFLNSHELSVQQKKALSCFIAYVRLIVTEKYGQTHWNTKSPSEIIDISNDMVRFLPQYQQEFPMERKILVDLVYILFKWMFKNKWTDHRLIRRSSDVTV